MRFKLEAGREFPKLKRFLYPALVFCAFIFGSVILLYGITQSDWHDFDVFYASAKAALDGKSIYIITGPHQLPFWYLPWTAWFYIPLAVWPLEFAKFLFKCITILSAIFIVNSLTRYYNPDFKFLDKVLILSLIIPMSLQLMIVGQMDYILLGLILITMYAIEQKKDILAGVLFPLLWIKPHLLIVFTLFAFWRAGKRTVLISVALSAIMLLIETVISPGWYLEMLNLLRGGIDRTGGMVFTTLPNLLGSRENMVGTANLPFTILLIILALLIVWEFRSLPTLPLLSLALAASLFCAPRAYAYDLVLLIPAMSWLTANQFRSTFWIWIAAAAIPILAWFLVGSYLVVLLVFLLCIGKAYRLNSITRLESRNAIE